MKKLKESIANFWEIYPDLVAVAIWILILFYYDDEAPLLYWIAMSFAVPEIIITLWSYRKKIWQKLKNILKKLR